MSFVLVLASVGCPDAADQAANQGGFVMQVTTFLGRLEGVRQTGHSKWIAKCPAHDDRSPSLSISEGDDGRVLLHCFGGCHVDAIIDAVGMTLSDLFPPPTGVYREGPVTRRPNYKAMWLLARRAFYVLVVATEDVAQGNTLSGEDLTAVRRAQGRIVDVMQVFNDE